MPTEIERKFTIEPGQDVPDLSGVVRVGRTLEMELDATYLDTPDLTLARNRITLRRRTGGGDEGWHLKLPGDGHAREEVHAPIEEGRGRFQVPAALREHIASLVGRTPLVPVARLETKRAETNLNDGSGGRVGVLCDDVVTATRGGTSHTWRELEVELVDGDESDLQRISEALAAAGVQPSVSTSKLVQALGERLAQEAPGAPDRRSSGAVVLGAYVAEQVGVIQSREAEVLVDAPDSVHKMRVAARRLRSALATFRPLLDVERTEPLRAELKWLGEVLGGPRDAEVLKARLADSLANLEPEAVRGDVVEAVTTALQTRHDEAHAALVEALATPRYGELIDALALLVAEPPFTKDADKKARTSLAESLDKAGRKVTRRWKAAGKASGEERLELVHEARKKAKAARYGWEAASPALAHGADAAAAWEEVTETLGSAQDTVVARERILELLDEVDPAGGGHFTLGVMWAVEQQHQSEAHGDADGAIRAAVKASRA